MRGKHVRFLAAAVSLAALFGCGSSQVSSNGTDSLAAWRAFHGPALAELEGLALRGSAAAQARDYAAVGSVCRDGMALIATARTGPVAPDPELRIHYSMMEDSYDAGFSTCATGTAASAEESLATLDRGNEQLRATTARLRVLANK